LILAINPGLFVFVIYQFIPVYLFIPVPVIRYPCVSHGNSGPRVICRPTSSYRSFDFIQPITVLCLLFFIKVLKRWELSPPL